MSSRPTFPRSIGPAIIVAAVVLGPGSILTSSRVGAEFGYSMGWVVLAACLLMAGMTVLSMRIGIGLPGTPCGEIACRIGRPAAALIGVILFLVVASFQSSNNFALAASAEALGIKSSKGSAIGLILVTNVLALSAVYGAREVYRTVERLMKIFVLLMVGAFLVNAVSADASLIELLKGLVPSWKTAAASSERTLLIAWIATTFSVAGAFYQAYLVREKGWGTGDSGRGTVDAVVGIGTLGAVSLVIMMTSAAVLFGTSGAEKLTGVDEVARQLEPFFGSASRIVFGAGILAAALSSFLVNAMVGGLLLSDGLGLGSAMGGRWPRHFTALALLFGMAVAIFFTFSGTKPAGLIIFAQALTVIGGPALAFALLYLGTRPGVRAPVAAITLAATGALVISVLAANTARGVYRKVIEKPGATAESNATTLTKPSPGSEPNPGPEGPARTE